MYILLILSGIPERRSELISHQPSIDRIFNVIKLDPMSEEETKLFYTSTFGKQNIRIEKDALDPLVVSSGGFPMLMHEVGDATFWKDNDKVIDSDDAWNGIMDAAANIGQKILSPQVYEQLRSQSYRSILRSFGKLPLGHSFRGQDFSKKLNEKERKNFDNFIRRIEKLGLLTGTEAAGEYKFVNNLYHVYVNLEAYTQEKRKS